jgi:hypothetical protein
MSRLEIGEVGGAQVPDSLLKKAQERAEKLKQMQAQRAAEKDAKDRENILVRREELLLFFFFFVIFSSPNRISKL